MNKDQLRHTPYFFRVAPSELYGFDELVEWLEAILHGPCSIYEEDGEVFLIEAKQEVDRLDGLKIEIFPNEHPPPHFHVTSPNIKASFDIQSCKLLKGHICGSDRKKIEFWFSHSKSKLVEIWNSTRPTSCTVGKYDGN